MKLNNLSQDETNIEATTGLVRNFSIECNAVMFQAMTSKLYSNPIRAVIRELSCNAKDSHVMAGKGDVPFKIVLPTYLNPVFRVEDFGLGLSDENVLRLFSTLGASNKRDSNSTIGGFGIGSKSPFAVSDTYTIISWFEGKKTTYVCSVDNGLPKIIRMAISTDTEHGNGVAVEVPVAQENHPAWEREFVNFFRFWDVKPNSNFKGTFPVVNTLYGIKSVDLTGGSLGNSYGRFYSSGTTFVASMGGVSYELPEVYVPDWFLSFFKTNLWGVCKLVSVELPIGTLTVTPNRENLKFDDQTKEYIEQSLESFKEAVSKELDTLVAPFGTNQRLIWQALKDYEQEKNVKVRPFYLGGKYKYDTYSSKSDSSSVDISYYNVEVTTSKVGNINVRIKPETLVTRQGRTRATVDVLSLVIGTTVLKDKDTALTSRDVIQKLRFLHKANGSPSYESYSIVDVEDLVHVLDECYYTDEFGTQDYKVILEKLGIELPPKFEEITNDKSPRISLGPKSQDLSDYVTDVHGSKGVLTTFASCKPGTPKYFLRKTHSGMTLNEKNNLSRLLDFLGVKDDTYLFLQRASDAFTKEASTSEWINLDEPANVVKLAEEKWIKEDEIYNGMFNWHTVNYPDFFNYTNEGDVPNVEDPILRDLLTRYFDCRYKSDYTVEKVEVNLNKLLNFGVSQADVTALVAKLKAVGNKCAFKFMTYETSHILYARNTYVDFRPTSREDTVRIINALYKTR